MLCHYHSTIETDEICLRWQDVESAVVVEGAVVAVHDASQSGIFRNLRVHTHSRGFGMFARLLTQQMSQVFIPVDSRTF